MSHILAHTRCMTRTEWGLRRGLAALVRAGVLLLAAGTLCAAQVTKDPQQIELGRAMFRNACAPCHGIRAQGGRGPDLTRGHYNNGDSDADLFRVISHGVPGTKMPAVRPDLIDSAGVWLVISFIRSVTQAEVGPAPGDRAAGEKLFWEKGGCGQCHALGGRGGSLGPDLTRVGRERSLAYLRESIVSPNADISPGYETVTVETRDRRKIVGVATRLDNFSVELMDLSGKVYSFQRTALISVSRESRSLMPAYGGTFSHTEMDDLLAYLSSLRESAVRPPAPTSTAWLNEKRLVTAQDDPTTWLMYARNYAGWRYSPLKQINAANVAGLRPQWIYPTSTAGGFETTPLVYDGMMWLTGPSNHAYALDLRTGREIWKYHSNMPEGVNLCCGQPNRGFAALGGLSFKVNLEGVLLAFDSKSGQVIWKTQLADYHKGYSATGAPLVVKNLVIVGIAGAENGQRGFIDAYETQTGKRVWRFYVVPAGGEPGSETWAGDSWKNGGGHPWTTGTYDPDLNLVYWGTANPGPDENGDVRAGDNLYTCSLVALDADTGKLKWYYQFTPHDTHDWDAISDPVLVDLLYHGRRVKAVIHANRNGFFYALDRTNGKVLVAKPYTTVTWAKGIGPDGRPIRVPGQEPSEDGTRTCPGLGGGHNWQATAYSPQTALYYFNSTDACELFYKFQQPYVEGQIYQASTDTPAPGELGTEWILAVDPSTGEIKWRFELVRGEKAGLLATAGDLVFTGDSEGYVFALDARTGKALWHFQAGGRVDTAPITYSVDGKQVLAVTSGSNVLTFTLP
jgi:alcohol dehydrogenase (cytochrome c)